MKAKTFQSCMLDTVVRFYYKNACGKTCGKHRKAQFKLFHHYNTSGTLLDCSENPLHYHKKNEREWE